MITIAINGEVGSFAEDKDAAARLRSKKLLPAMAKGQKVRIDFTGVTLATQSFVHALIAQSLFKYGEKALAMVEYRGCEPSVKGIIETVVQYVLEARDDET